MAIMAMREAFASHSVEQPVPLVLAMPDAQVDKEGLSPLLENLEQNCQPWIVNQREYDRQQREPGLDESGSGIFD